jgi:ribosomal protein S9
MRDGHRCQMKLGGCTTTATHVHHTLAREIVGDDPKYLKSSCASCNLKIGDPRNANPKAQPKTKW